MKSIYFRNFLSTAMMVLLSFLIIGAALFFMGQHFIIDSHRENMKSNAEAVAHMTDAVGYYDDFFSWDMRISLSVAAEISGNDIFVTDGEGRIASCSDEPAAAATSAPASTRRAWPSSPRRASSTKSATSAASSRRAAMSTPCPFSEADPSAGYVFVSSTRSTIIGAWTAFLWVFLAVALAVLSLALVMSLVISKKLSEPLDEMTAAARRFAHGDFSVRVREDKGTDELAALTSSFNAMARSARLCEELRNEFIANVSHELKTPMTTIAGFADGILDGTIPKDQEDKYLATIADETRRLSRLVRHMLSLSRLRSEGSDLAKRRDFDLNELIIRTLLNFETRAEDKRLGMDLQLPEDHMTVTADPDSITQVLYNLLDNAVKFAQPDSAITVALRKENGKAYVSVKNRGETIPADDPAAYLRPLPQVRPLPAASTATAWASGSISSRASSTRTTRTSRSRARTGSPSSSSPSPSRAKSPGAKRPRPKRRRRPRRPRPARRRRPGPKRPGRPPASRPPAAAPG